MVLVGGKPFLEHEIGLLRRSGIEDFVLCVGYLGEKVEAHFGDGGGWGVRVRYSYDGPKLLGRPGRSSEPSPSSRSASSSRTATPICGRTIEG